MASTQCAASHRAPLTGWLMKRKSESGKNWFLKSVNKRFFTLDFESQIFYYSHNENNKEVSMPKLFREILAVDPIAHQELQEACNQDACLQGYQASEAKRTAAGFHTAACLQRMPFSSQALLNTIPNFSGFTKRSPEQHGFVIKLRGKIMELICNSKEEAEMWIDGIREAITMAQSGCRQMKSAKRPCSKESCTTSVSETSTSPPSSHATTPRSSSQSTDDSEQTPPGGKGQQFPPLAPGTPPLDKQQPIESLGFGGDIVRRNHTLGNLPLAPGVSLRATAAGA